MVVNETEGLPPKLLKECPECKWRGLTGLTTCYRRMHHADSKTRWLSIVQEN